MTPEEQRLAELLGQLGERHVATGTDGAWLGPQVRRARRRRSLAAAAVAAVAVVAIAGGVAATTGGPQAEPPPPASSPTASPSASPAVVEPLFVSAIGVRPDGSGAAVVGPCQLPRGTCEQTMRRTANAGKTLDAMARADLPVGPRAPVPTRVTAAGRFVLYVWQPGPLIAWSADNGNTWKQAGLDSSIVDIDPAPDTDSVWMMTRACSATARSTGCELRLLSGRAGQDPRSFRALDLPVSLSVGPVSMSRGAGGRAAVAVGRPVTGGAAASDVVYTTNDDGGTWTRQDLPCQQTPADYWLPVDVSLASDGSVWALCAEGTGGAGVLRKRMYVSDGPGVAFRAAGSLPARGTSASIGAASRTTAWVSADQGPVMGTADGGRTWTAVTGDSAFVGPVQVLPDGTALAAGQVDGHGAVWIGTGTARWTAHPVHGPNLGPEFSDCNALQPGDDLDYGSLNCNADQVVVRTIDCSTGIYVHLGRGNNGDLEGITGVTPTWRAAEPVDPRYGRTPYAFHNCFEEEAGGGAFVTPSPQASGDLWPATHDLPAAGVCGTDPGPFATIEANPDVPAPRCQIVRPDQRLRVRNTTDRFNQAGEVITVQFAGYPTRTLAIGAETVFDRPMGDYLAPGVHDVHLSVYRGSGGGEIWLKE
jgi:hypothetical protein